MENKGTATRAEKKERVKNLIKEVLKEKEYKHNDLIEQSATLYVERFESDTDNINDVKGRIGSVLDIMKKESEVQFEGGVYALNVKKEEEKLLSDAPVSEKKQRKTTRKKAVKEEVNSEESTKEKAEEKEIQSKKTPTKRAKKTEEKMEEPKEKEKKPLPPPPIQPIAPIAPTSPEVAPKPEKKAVKRGRAKKAVEEAEIIAQSIQPAVENKAETPLKVDETEEKKAQTIEKKAIEGTTTTALTETKKGELAPKATVMDMSFLFGVSKPVKEEKKQEKTEDKAEVKKEETVEQTAEKKEEKQPVKQVKTQPQTNAIRLQEKQEKQEKEPSNRRKIPLKKTVKVLTADEKLKETFLKKIRSLGGDYFEYYSVYLLEKYSRINGRRLEGLRISAGDHDGGIDGEIELTDKLGFRETIYIQSKNWNPEKGDERLWVVGETLLQQFIGACACRQAKEGKQHCRGVFITTSRFTPEAKRILQDMSDKIVGYDGEDLYEAAKECAFGLVKKNGEWAIDEQLLSGEKAFFSML